MMIRDGRVFEGDRDRRGRPGDQHQPDPAQGQPHRQPRQRKRRTPGGKRRHRRAAAACSSSKAVTDRSTESSVSRATSPKRSAGRKRKGGIRPGRRDRGHPERRIQDRTLDGQRQRRQRRGRQGACRRRNRTAGLAAGGGISAALPEGGSPRASSPARSAATSPKPAPGPEERRRSVGGAGLIARDGETGVHASPTRRSPATRSATGRAKGALGRASPPASSPRRSGEPRHRHLHQARRSPPTGSNRRRRRAAAATSSPPGAPTRSSFRTTIVANGVRPGRVARTAGSPGSHAARLPGLQPRQPRPVRIQSRRRQGQQEPAAAARSQSNGGPTADDALPAPRDRPGSGVPDPGSQRHFGLAAGLDQRGVLRPIDLPSIPNSTAPGADGSDIGAVELQPAQRADPRQAGQEQEEGHGDPGRHPAGALGRRPEPERQGPEARRP